MGQQVFVGLDWAEDRDDVFVEDDTGLRDLAGGRLLEGIVRGGPVPRTGRRTC